MTAVVPPKSFARAIVEIRDGLRERQLWAHLGWQDIKQRYRRSVIGPLWITISMVVLALALGLVNSVLFGADIGTILPNITVGLIVWTFISGCVLEGSDTFISNEGLIKILPAPLMVYILRTVWRQTLLFAHNMIVYVLILAVFFVDIDHPYKIFEFSNITQPGLNWGIVLAIPAFVAIMANGAWVALLFGIVATRFRDIPPLVNSFITMIFYMTPIMWSMDQVSHGNGGKNASALSLLKLNPAYHFIEILRAPLLGQVQSWTHWAVVGGFTVVGWSVALLALRNYRSRVSYWV